MPVRGSASLNTWRPHRPLVILGALLVSISSIVGSGFSPLAIPFTLWSLLPYGLLWIVGARISNPWLTVGAGTAALAAEAGIRASVFVWPRGSTAAIALVFSPAFIAAMVMPIGVAAGWLFGKAWRWHLAGRLLVGVVWPTALALLVLGLARPELFPTTVMKRRALLARVGEPRVVVGSDTFEIIAVSNKAAWHVAAELDGQPGDEVAVVDHGGADLFDAATMAMKGRVDFGGQPGRLWGSFSTLVRLPGGELAVAQTGGGFSRTLLQDLSGAERWEYRPHPGLAPDAMRPADLDGDGENEFYATSSDRVVRLDLSGREVWNQRASMSSLIALLPRTADSPAWILGVEYGRRAVVWDASGAVMAERAVTAEDSPMTAVDSFAGRCLVFGGRSARGMATRGQLLFDVPLGDFTLSYATGARLASDVPSLVLIASTDRDSSRYRLLIVGPDRRVAYDEILDHYPRIVVARRADGRDSLLVGDAQGLRWLRPRAG